jgi:hypothetical protein
MQLAGLKITSMSPQYGAGCIFLEDSPIQPRRHEQSTVEQQLDFLLVFRSAASTARSAVVGLVQQGC